MNDWEDAWDEWMHFNWSDDNDMELVEAAFRAGFAAGSDDIPVIVIPDPEPHVSGQEDER